MKKRQEKGLKPERPRARNRTTWTKETRPKSPGRPPLPSDYKEAMAKIGPASMQALESIVSNPKHPRHEQAVEYAINRWKGTPTARTEISGPGGGPVPMKTVLTSDEKRRRSIELAAVAAARIAQGKKAAEDDEPTGSE